MTRGRLCCLWLSILAFASFGCDSGPTGDGQALVGVTVIDGLGNPPVADQVVWIRDGRIADVVAADGWQAPRGVQEIDMSGRFVMPGLIDLHAHVTLLAVGSEGVVSTIDRADSERMLKTLLGFGITTVRNPAAPAEAGVALRDAVASGEILGPRILTAGNPLARTAAFPPLVATPDEDSVRQEIRRQAALGVDLIKVYSSLAPELVASAIDEAHTNDLPVVGHLQRTTWTEGVQAGIDQITHGAPWSTAYLSTEDQEGYRGTIRDRLTWLEKVDFEGETIQEMIALLAEREIPVDPTLIAYHTKFFGDDPMHRENPELHLAPEASREAWSRSTFVDDWTPEDFERAQALWPRVLELTKKLYDAGVPLAAGSDVPNPWVIPGVSFHHELRLLHDAGIPSLDVLKIATSGGANALGLEAEIGSIEPGKIADLVVLTSDPSKNLFSTRAISHVFLGGRFLDPSAMLE